MDFRTTIIKTLLGEEIDYYQLDEEFLALLEDNPFDELPEETILEIMETSLFQHLDEVLSKKAYVSAMYRATDPEVETPHDRVEKIVARAKKHHGEKFAKDLQSGAHKMNWPRTYGKDKVDMIGYHNDPLSYRKKSRATSTGKVNKQDVKTLKTKIKTGSY